MFRFESRFRRRVHINHKHGALVVTIERNNDRSTYVVMLIAFTIAFLFFCFWFIPPIFRDPSGVVYVLPILAFIALWYLVGLRLTIWRLFGIEQVLVEGGVLLWTRTALWWVRTFETPTADVSEVRTITPWHSLSNCVEFTARGNRQRIGDMLLRDETLELADHLAEAVGLRAESPSTPAAS